MTGAPIAAAVISKKRRQIIDAFRVASATTPENAQTLEQLGLHDSNLFKIQVWKRVIVLVHENRFYLDERRVIEVELQRRIIVAAVAILVFALVYLLNR